MHCFSHNKVMFYAKIYMWNSTVLLVKEDRKLPLLVFIEKNRDVLAIAEKAQVRQKCNERMCVCFMVGATKT